MGTYYRWNKSSLIGVIQEGTSLIESEDRVAGNKNYIYKITSFEFDDSLGSIGQQYRIHIKSFEKYTVVKGENTLQEGCYYVAENFARDLSDGTLLATTIFKASATSKYIHATSGYVYWNNVYLVKTVDVKGDFIGYVYNANANAYPNGNSSGNYWYSDRKSFTSASAPASIRVGTPESKKSLSISWGAATAGSVSISGYILQRSVDEGSWKQVKKAKVNTYTDTVDASWTTVAYRVCAYDANGMNGDFKTSATLTVIHNTAPTIDGSDSDLGSFSTNIPSVSYTVNDEDGDTVNVTVSLDGVTKKTHAVTLGEANSFTFTEDEWRKILNGSHTIKLIADDGQGAIAVRQYTFTKNITSMSFTLATPLDADGMITKALETLNAVIPDGATLTIEVCNNGYDDSPTWQDVTRRVLNGDKIFISNTEKTADKWGYNVRVTVDRNGATGDCYISGMAGFFE